MRIKLDNGAYIPIRAHLLDAGYDLKSREDCIIKANESAEFDIGVHVEIPHGFVGMLKSKSGLNVKHGITSEGVIDSGYTGSIIAKLYNHSDKDYAVHRGDKITQLVIMPVLTPNLEVVDYIEGGERGNDGFGSSGR